MLLALPMALLFQAARPDAGAVVVRLDDALTRQPIADARVSISRMVWPEPKFFGGTTDTEGVARLEGVPAGSYDVFVKRLGYVDFNYLGMQRLRVTVVPGGEVEVKASLEPTATIEGRVIGEDNESLAGVTIHAEPETGMAIPAESGKDGRFKIEYLRTGTFRFRLLFPEDRIRAALRVDKEKGERWSYPGSAYHPGSTVLAPGMTLTGFDLRAQRVLLAELTGRLTDAVTRAPLPGGEVELVPEVGGKAQRRPAANSGHFQFPFVIPGVYSLLIYRDGRRDAIPYATQVDIGPGGIGDHLVRVPAFGRVEGRFTKVLAGERVHLFGAGGQWTEGEVAPDGSFVFERVAPGPVRLTAQLKGRSYIRRVLAGGREATVSGPGHEFVVPEGGLEVEAQISDEAGVVVGRVVDEKDNPVPNARVQGPNRGMTDQFGNFRIEPVPPGEHTFYVCRSRAERVQVKPNATVSVTLRDCTRP